MASQPSALHECIRSLYSSSAPLPPASRFSAAISELMSGSVSPVSAATFLSALSPARFTPEIVTACASGMRSQSVPFPPLSPNLAVLDIVGTGGDGADTFNVSTASSLIIAASGVPVVKHGNRSSSSKCGSADLLEALGVKLELNGSEALRVLSTCGYVFLFAQAFHPAMKHVAPVRKGMGVRTIFNLLGPLTNPCPVNYQVTGVFDRSLGPLFAECFRQLGIKRAAVVHSDDGMDELSPAEKSHVWWMEQGKETREFDLSPEDFGLCRHSIAEVHSGDAKQNANTLRKLFDHNGKDGQLDSYCSAVLDYILLNCAFALVVAGKASDWKAGVALAREAIHSGKAKALLDAYIAASQAAAAPKTILETIAEHRQKLVNEAKQVLPLDALLLQALRAGTPQSIPVMERVAAGAVNGMSLAAEIKRASPSLGDINASIDPVSQALTYARGGASLISVLTEPKWFKGSIDDLRAVRRAVEALPHRPAVLLKDFVLEEYQLAEARAAGADTALLIVAILPEARLRTLIAFARQLGMEPLVEVANKQELITALNARSLFIGVNNRDLHTFTVNTDRTNSLAGELEEYFVSQGLTGSARPQIMLAALSGIKTRADVQRYQDCGAKLVLVGETLMKADDPEDKIRELLGASNQSKNNQPRAAPAPMLLSLSPAHSAAPPAAPYVKICGLRDFASAHAASRCGADFLGFIFAEKSKRRIEVEDAKEIIRNLNPKFIHQLGPVAVGGLEKLLRAVRGRPLAVGVFLDQSVEEMNEIAEEVGLDIIQLHGTEGFDIAEKLVRPVIRVLPVVPGETTAESILDLLRKERQSGWRISGVLLDTKLPSGSGGTGASFDWSIARAVGAEFPLVLAGGLTPDNVRQAVSEARPWAVDVSSGVEIDTEQQSEQGPKKDHIKIRQFITSAKGL